ncbi:hypothetical protein ACIPVB_04945 [Microbacterium sp. NPDC090007]|uniref:hypothetical protein n=1 Tax=Microbacterium sp. NPDC090007 TaxID=3364204 RepID=UPI00382A7776
MPTDVRIAVTGDDPSRKVHAMTPAISDARPPASRCVYGWCVTPHGDTVHPADEDHRSDGVGLTIRVRDARACGDGDLRAVEIGVLRRRDDTATWIVVEAGGRASFALALEDAGAIGRQLEREVERARGQAGASPRSSSR